MKFDFQESLNSPKHLDPVVESTKEMLAQLQIVDEPARIMPVIDVPEFGNQIEVMQNGIAIIVDQRRFKSTERTPIRSDNAAQCDYAILKTPLSDGKFQYTLIHVYEGDLESNAFGYRLDDVAKITNAQSTTIHVSSDTHTINSTAIDLKYKGITSTKHIKVPTKRQYLSIVYRPETNEVLTRIGESETVNVYQGF